MSPRFSSKTWLISSTVPVISTSGSASATIVTFWPSDVDDFDLGQVVGFDIQLRQVGDAHHRLRRGDILAGDQVQLDDRAVDGGLQLQVPQVGLGGFQVFLGGFDAGFGGGDVIGVGAFLQILVVFQRLFQAGLGGAQVGFELQPAYRGVVIALGGVQVFLAIFAGIDRLRRSICTARMRSRA